MALAACVKGPEPADWPGPTAMPSPAIATIDSLTWQQPDSALALLLPWFDTCRDAMLASPTNKPGVTALETHSMRLYDQHYAHLLLAELLYKNNTNHSFGFNWQ